MEIGMGRWGAAMLFSAVLLLSSQAFAGPYLNTAAMLLQENTVAARWVRGNIGDKQLAQNAHKMAQARVDVAAQMNVPAEVKQAHPHLLLALTAMERAMQAASEGQVSNFIAQLQSSTGEAKTFEAVLKTLGFSLPQNQRVDVGKRAAKRVRQGDGGHGIGLVTLGLRRSYALSYLSVRAARST